MPHAQVLPHPNKNNFLIGFSFALLAVILWSGNFIAAKALHKNISPISLAFFRWITATVILFPFVYRKFFEERKIISQHLKYISFTVLTGVTLFNTLIYVAGKYTTATNLALISTTAAPIFVLIISGLILKQKLSWNQIFGAIVCVAGILVLMSKGSMEGLKNLQFSSGDGWIFLAALSFAIYTVLVRRKPKEISPATFLFAIFLAGTIFLLPPFIFEALKGNTIQWNRNIILSIIYLGLGASVIAFLSWNISIQRLGSPRTALFGNLIPIFSTIEASMILNESFSQITIISLVIILTGIVIANLNFLKRRKKPEKVIDQESVKMLPTK